MKKFEETFRLKSENKYPFVRFVRAEYSRSENKLLIYFLATAQAVDGGILSDAVKEDIVNTIVPLLPDEITFSVKYIKVHADEETVRVRLMQAITKYVGVAAQAIKPEDVLVRVDEYVIDVRIKAQKAYFSLLNAEDVRDNVVSYLNDNFVENVNYEIIEKYITEEEKRKISEKSLKTVENAGLNCNISVNDDGTVKEDGNHVFTDLIDPSQDTVVLYEQVRQIKATPVENLVGKAYMNVLPMYIGDIKDTLETATVCGKVAGLEKREYKNKNYGLNLPTGGRFKKNTTDEKLPMYSFFIDDTTGKLAVVYFAKDTNVNALDLSLREGADVVISGKLGERNGIRQILADKMWLADVDYSTIKTELPAKPVSKNYYLVHPEKYFEESQCGMDELMDGKKEVAPYLKGKTFVVFDLETTGLDIGRCKIVQIGSYKIVDGKIVETFSTLVNPGCHIPEDTSAIHGLYDKDVENAPDFKEIVADFYKFSRGATLVGHNAFGFDYPILVRLAKECGYNFDNPVLDTRVIAKNQYRLPSYNLQNLSKYFGIDLECAHNADFDAIATAKLFLILAEKLK